MASGSRLRCRCATIHAIPPTPLSLLPQSLNVLTKTITMLGLMLAPAYLSFGEFNGFGQTGSAIGGACAARTSDGGGGGGGATRAHLLPSASPHPAFLNASHPAAVAMIVVIGALTYLLVSHFRRLNAKSFNEAVVKKKAADAKLASGAYGNADANEEVARHMGGERDNLSTPLIR